MLQLRVIVVLLVPMCVGRASPMYASKEEHPSKVDIGNLKEPTDILSNSSSKATTSSIKAAEDNTGMKTANETNSTLTNTGNAGVNTPLGKTIDEKMEDNEKLNNNKQNNEKLNNDKQNSEKLNNEEQNSEKLNNEEQNSEKLNNEEQNSEKLNKEQVNNETESNEKQNSSEKQNSEKQNDKKENCTSTKEADDMLHCNKYPQDDDVDSLNATESTLTNTTTANNKTGSTTESQVPKVIPREKEKDEAKDGKISGNSTQTTTKVHYAIVSSDTNHTINTNNSDVPNSTNSKDSTNTTETSLGVSKVEHINEAIKVANSIDRNNSKHMSPGIIALVTAISFAVVIALVYIGMIVWRRYIEYRYGHRELLVNELEFDTNDLRHFEL